MNDCLLSIYTYIIFFYEKNIKVVYKGIQEIWIIKQ
ncbi:hypothetical protein [African swine fever virus]